MLHCAGRLLGELLRLSDPIQTQHQALRCAWQDAGGAEVLGLTAFESLRSTLGPPGLAALDQLLAHRAAWALQQALRLLQLELGNGALLVVSNVCSSLNAWPP